MSLLISPLTNLSGFSLSEAITLKIDFSKSQSSWSIKDTKKLKIGNERGEKTSSEQYFTLLKIWYKRITWYIEERAELALHGSLNIMSKKSPGKESRQLFIIYRMQIIGCKFMSIFVKLFVYQETAIVVLFLNEGLVKHFVKPKLQVFLISFFTSPVFIKSILSLICQTWWVEFRLITFFFHWKKLKRVHLLIAEKTLILHRVNMG